MDPHVYAHQSNSPEAPPTSPQDALIDSNTEDELGPDDARTVDGETSDDEHSDIRHVEIRGREDMAQYCLAQPKWGFIIYRTVYDGPEEWTEFMKTFKSKVFENMSLSGDQELIDTLAFDVRDDETLFKNRSRLEIREHFLAWRSSVQSNSTTDAPNSFDPRRSRYNFFIFIDREVLNSILGKQPESWMGILPGYVQLVNSQWPTDYDTESDDRFRLQEPTQVEVLHDNGIYVRVFPNYLYPDLYTTCSDANSWPQQYFRPPRVLNGSLLGYSLRHRQNFTMLLQVTKQRIYDGEE